MRHRIYIAAPYTAATDTGGPGRSTEVLVNVRRAIDAALECMRRGHDVHCPHSHTHMLSDRAHMTGQLVGYGDWIAMDATYIDHWATALLYLAPSPGADRELAMACERDLRIFRSIDEVPAVKRRR